MSKLSWPSEVGPRCERHLCRVALERVSSLLQRTRLVKKNRTQTSNTNKKPISDCSAERMTSLTLWFSGIGHNKRDHEDAIRWLSFWMCFFQEESGNGKWTPLSEQTWEACRRLAKASSLCCDAIQGTYRRYPSKEMKQLCKWANTFC